MRLEFCLHTLKLFDHCFGHAESTMQPVLKISTQRGHLKEIPDRLSFLVCLFASLFTYKSRENVLFVLWNGITALI